MRRYKYVKWLVVMALATSVAGQTWAITAPASPDGTGKVLRALLTISNEAIPGTSSCQGNYGQQGKAMVKDLIAVQLAYLYSGENTIQGNCISTLCTLSIAHASGEDVSSAIIKFKLVRDKASVSTLQCVITP